MSGWPVVAACGALAVLCGLLVWQLVRALQKRIDAKTGRG